MLSLDIDVYDCIRAYDNGQSSDIFRPTLAFDQTNLLYIINGEVNECIIGKQMSGQFLILIISTAVCAKLICLNSCIGGNFGDVYFS